MKRNIERENILDLVKNTGEKLCIMYHKDMDGLIGASQIMHFIKLFADKNLEEVSFIGCQYKEDYIGLLPEGQKDIIFIDFSPTREEAEDLLNEGHNVIVIDHHIGAFIKLDGLENKFVNYFYWFNNDKAGCGLANEIFIEGTGREELEFDRMSIISAYAEDRDLWKFELPYSKEINAGLLELFNDRAMSWDDVDGMWRLLNTSIEFNDEWYNPDSEEFMDLVLMLGRNKIEYDAKYVQKFFKLAEKKKLPLIKIGGVEMYCFNNSNLISEVGNKLTELDYPSCQYFIVHKYNKDGVLQTPQVVLSFRSTDELPDVRLVAVQLGGNGHRNACGAELKLEDLPSLLSGQL